MKSPEYTVPVMDFIDENCMVFDADEVHLFRFRCHSRSRARLLRGITLLTRSKAT